MKKFFALLGVAVLCAGQGCPGFGPTVVTPCDPLIDPTCGGPVVACDPTIDPTCPVTPICDPTIDPFCPS